MTDNACQSALVAIQWNMLNATGHDGVIGTKEYSLDTGIKQASERKISVGILPSDGPDLCSQEGRKGEGFLKLVLNYIR